MKLDEAVKTLAPDKRKWVVPEWEFSEMYF